ncbi:hypothetical protein [Flavivirga eckloniae]|uniref:Uncharacterized protein n=1 Tax=Flavivirga eckloniae TaxID=1803846 RepID=A0A2K9PW38_9FLAO|nr:hypothetical protein [Flavivirga eckloniae]AUP81274.1 hypothetical protein C1H87_22165 [Flavivirga eckloniae]
MKRIITNIIVFFFIGITVYGQEPTWSVNENDFEYTMSFVAFLNVDGATLTSTNDKVAAFVGGECRGVTNLIYVSGKDRYYAYFNVFSNTNGEALNFKVYDSTNDNVVDIVKTVNFEINALYGDLAQAFSFASPALNDKAELISFNFKDVTISNRNIQDNAMTLYVDNGINVSALTSIFELSTGAQLFSESQKLISDSNVLDFTNSVIVEVLSEDESTRNEWEITVSYNAVIGNLTFYKKDAVCYSGGAIKVLSSENGSEVVLLKNQVVQAAQTLNNGEVIFTSLGAGDYTIQVNGFEKQISINLKE